MMIETPRKKLKSCPCLQIFNYMWFILVTKQVNENCCLFLTLLILLKKILCRLFMKASEEEFKKRSNLFHMGNLVQLSSLNMSSVHTSICTHLSMVLVLTANFLVPNLLSKILKLQMSRLLQKASFTSRQTTLPNNNLHTYIWDPRILNLDTTAVQKIPQTKQDT